MKHHNSAILLVEDNRVNQFVINEILTRLECTVQCASSGEEALQKAGGKQFDLILLDLQLPGIDGFETAKRLKDTGNRAPIVAISGFSDEKTRRRCLADGFSRLISKPFPATTLHTLLKELLGIEQAEEIMQAPEEDPAESELSSRILRTIKERDYSDESCRRMMEVAPAEIREHLELIIQGFDEDDMQLIAREAHSLKGSFGALGLEEYRRRSAEIYLAVRILLHGEEFATYLDKNGLLFREIEGGHRLFLPGEYAVIPGPEKLRQDLQAYLKRALNQLHTRELVRFIDPEIEKDP